uniref:RNA-directed DNA polymerase (Reverse transcriptase) n=1 Tax=Solanum tuberosum TaxID=4113 RepID=M1D5L9_SOLTU
MNPPKNVIEQIHQMFAKFFWGSTGSLKRKHWVAWEDMCIPKKEGGLGFRSLHAVNNALFAKLWWNFRTSTSLWSNYMGNKYCKKRHPIVSRSVGATHVWKKMVAIREEVEHEIWWQLKAGTSSFWFDNLTKQGTLFYTEGESARDEEIEVKEFIEEGSWKREKLRNYLSEEMTEHIVINVLPCTSEMNDKAWWMGSSVGNFTVKSAFHLVRHKREQIDYCRNIWIKKLPLKISFFFYGKSGKKELPLMII